jgi:hypothetical protein
MTFETEQVTIAYHEVVKMMMMMMTVATILMVFVRV